MSIVERPSHAPSFTSPSTAALPLGDLPQPPRRFTPIPLVKLCYTMVHAAEAVGIRDLADGEYRPGDTTLEQGIERQLNYLLDEVGCTRPGFRLLEIGSGYGHLLRLAQRRGAQVVGVNISPEQVQYSGISHLARSWNRSRLVTVAILSTRPPAPRLARNEFSSFSPS